MNVGICAVVNASAVTSVQSCAVAYGFHAAPRGTNDLDLNVFVDSRHAEPAINALISSGLELNRGQAIQLLFFRGKDLTDIERMLGVRGRDFDRATVRHWLVSSLGKDDHRVVKWDELCAQIPVG